MSGGKVELSLSASDTKECVTCGFKCEGGSSELESPELESTSFSTGRATSSTGEKSASVGLGELSAGEHPLGKAVDGGRMPPWSELTKKESFGSGPLVKTAICKYFKTNPSSPQYRSFSIDIGPEGESSPVLVRWVRPYALEKGGVLYVRYKVSIRVKRPYYF